MKKQLLRCLVFSILIVAPVVSTGCAVRSGTVVTNPADTPQYRVQQGLLILAKASATTGTVARDLHTKGSLTTAWARGVLDYTDAVDSFCIAATNTMRSGLSAKEKAAAIQSAIKTLPVTAVKNFLATSQGQATVAVIVNGLLAVQSTIEMLGVSLGSLQ